MVDDTSDAGIGLIEAAHELRVRWKLILFGALAAGLVALAIAFQIAPTFTARVSLMPPQQQQSVAASALATLGALSGLAGGGNIKSPADLYVSLMQSTTVADRMVDQFGLMAAYGANFRVDARRALQLNSRFEVGKKDGLIIIEVADGSPQRAADIANQYVEELRRLTSVLAVSEAQQRRVFFETQLQKVRDQLASAQQALQASGFTQGALRAEPKAAAEGYARLKAELTTAEVRLQTLRGSLADTAPEVRQQQATVDALRGHLAGFERSNKAGDSPDYIGKYREYKYQEALFEMFSRQYEIARVDESREGALIQVLDPATPPEKKSGPKKAQIAVLTTLAALVVLSAFVLLRRLRLKPERATG